MVELDRSAVPVPEPDTSALKALIDLDDLVAALEQPLAEDQRVRVRRIRAVLRHVAGDAAKLDVFEDGKSDSAGIKGLRSKVRGHVLLVDDQESTRTYLRVVLAALGFGVIEASTAAEGEERIRDDVDLVLVDVHLPDMLGTDLVKRLRSEPVFLYLPIYGISSDRSETTRALASSSGMDDLLAKPVSLETLRRVTEHALRQRSRLSIESIPGTFDKRALVDLIVMDDGEMLESFINQAMRDADVRVDQLRQARKSGDGKAWREAAHGLQGVALTLGGEGLDRAIGRALGGEGFLEDPAAEEEFGRLLENLKVPVTKMLVR